MQERLQPGMVPLRTGRQAIAAGHHLQAAENMVQPHRKVITTPPPSVSPSEPYTEAFLFTFEHTGLKPLRHVITLIPVTWSLRP